MFNYSLSQTVLVGLAILLPALLSALFAEFFYLRRVRRVRTKSRRFFLIWSVVIGLVIFLAIRTIAIQQQMIFVGNWQWLSYGAFSTIFFVVLRKEVLERVPRGKRLRKYFSGMRFFMFTFLIALYVILFDLVVSVSFRL